MIPSGKEPNQAHADKVSRPWFIMVSSVGPWESLTVPKDLREGGSKQDIISIEIRYAGERVPLPMVATAMEHLESVYAAVARVYLGPGQTANRKHQSGSLIRIDCRGIGEAVKQTKELLLEAWQKIRHKRPEELIEKNSAALSSLAVIETISTMEKKGSLPPEEAETLRRTIFTSVTRLYESNAMLADIRSLEVINHDKLLEGFSPKLLGAGTREVESDPHCTGAPIDGEKKSDIPKAPSGEKKRTAKKRSPRRNSSGDDNNLPRGTDPTDPLLLADRVLPSVRHLYAVPEGTRIPVIPHTQR